MWLWFLCQRRRPDVTVISRGDVPLTYLPTMFISFSDMGRGSTQEPPRRPFDNFNFLISSAASEPTPVFSPKPCRRHYFWFSGLFRRNHVADVFGLFCQNHVADLGHGNHSGELLLFVGCIVNFFVSYLICMFQDSVPAGSYNDPFLSSVCVHRYNKRF